MGGHPDISPLSDLSHTTEIDEATRHRAKLAVAQRLDPAQALEVLRMLGLVDEPDTSAERRAEQAREARRASMAQTRAARAAGEGEGAA